MRVAVTGADGFTGRYFTAALDDAGIAWVALNADLTDAAAVDRAVAAEPFDHLVHLAGQAFAGGGDWEAFYRVNQLGSFALLDAVARHRPGTRCLLASTAQVYGAKASGVLDERSPTAPSNHYAISKFAMELGAGLWVDRLEFVITRPFNYTGVGQPDEYILPKLVKHFRERLPVLEIGNTFPRRDFGDVRAVSAAYLGLLEHWTPGAIVPICTGEGHAIAEIIDMLAEMTGYRPELRTNPAFVRANEIEVLTGDPALLKALVPGWQPIALRDTLAWMLEPEAAQTAG